MRLASRVSINLEGPTDAVVRGLAVDKDLSGDLLPKLELAGACRGRRASTAARTWPRPRGRPRSSSWARKARRIATCSAWSSGSRRRGLLHHAHWSAFQPVAGTPMERVPAVPAAREFRLYQAEHLLRDYGFAFDELVFGADGNLPLDRDPKTVWALDHPARFPVELHARRATSSCGCRASARAPPTASSPCVAAPCCAARTTSGGSASTSREARTSWRSAAVAWRAGPPAEQLRLFPARRTPALGGVEDGGAAVCVPVSRRVAIGRRRIAQRVARRRPFGTPAPEID